MKTGFFGRCCIQSNLLVYYPSRNRTKIVLKIHNIDSRGDGWCDDCLDRMSVMTDNGIHVLVVVSNFNQVDGGVME